MLFLVHLYAATLCKKKLCDSCFPVNLRSSNHNLTKLTGKYLCQARNFIKKRLQHRCFPVDFVKFLRTPFLQNTSGRLPLLILSKFSKMSLSNCVAQKMKFSLKDFFGKCNQIRRKLRIFCGVLLPFIPSSLSLTDLVFCTKELLQNALVHLEKYCYEENDSLSQLKG